MRAIFLETSKEINVKIANVVVKRKKSKHFAVKPLVCGSWLYLSFDLHFDVISMLDKSTEHGKLFSIC